MMKKTCIVLMACLIILTGCAKAEKPPTATQEKPTDTAGEKIVFYCGDKVFPLSFTADGKQLIENGSYWYYELADDFEREWTDSFYTYSKEMELNGSKVYGEFGKKCRYATNGEWALFLSPVHTEFSAENQDKIDTELISMVNQQLASNNMEKATPQVTDLWECDFDGDGVQERIFLATDEVSYCFIGCVKEKSCQVIDGVFSVKELPKYSPAVCDLDGNAQWSLLLYKEGDYESLTVFDYSGGNFTKCYDIIF